MTDLGKLLVELPIDPQFGKMVLIGMTLKCLEPAIVIACCSAYKEPCKQTFGFFLLLQKPCQILCFTINFTLVHRLFFCND